MNLDNSRIVQFVRERSEYRMKFVEWEATYELDELAYGPSEQPPGQGELREYRIDRGSDNMAIGYIGGGKGWGNDSISSYCLAQLSNGLRLEFVQTNIDPRTTAIIRNSGPLVFVSVPSTVEFSAPIMTQCGNCCSEKLLLEGLCETSLLHGTTFSYLDPIKKGFP